MIKKSLYLLILICTIIKAENININLTANEWKLAGTPTDINISDLNLDSDDLVWHYKNEEWYVNIFNYRYNHIETLKAGDAFWIYSKTSKTITLPESLSSNLKTVDTGWTMFSPSFDINISDVFNNTVINSVWTYNDTNWSMWDPNNEYLNISYEKADSILVGEGSWINASSLYTPIVTTSTVTVGSDDTILSRGTFNNVIKSTTDTAENIWNITFPINLTDESNFKVGVKFVKESSGAVGEIVFTGLNISNGVIDDPDYIIIKGIKSDGTEGQTYFYSEYNPDSILSSAVVLDRNMLTLKLGTIMQKQTVTSDTTFKAISNYNLKINSDLLILKESKNISLGDLTNFSFGTDFDNKNGIEGIIEIH